MEAQEQMIQILELSKKKIKITMLFYDITMLLKLKEKIDKYDGKMNIFYQEMESINIKKAHKN